MAIKKILLLAMTLLAAALPANAVEFTYKYMGSTLKYRTIDNSTCEVIDVLSLNPKLTIPDSVVYNKTVYEVTSIGSYAFWGSGLTELTLPNSITSIDVAAFRECGGLTEIALPKSLSTLGSDAFDRCTGLTSVIITNGDTFYGEAPFRECRNIIKVAYPEDQYPSIFPSYPRFKVAFNPNGAVILEDGWIFGPEKSSILFAPLSLRDDFSIPNSVTNIGDLAFAGCSGLTGITLPDSLTSIGESAFYYCSGLTKLTLPESLTSISKKAFYGCSSLTVLTLPDSLTSIGESAFEECSRLTKLTLPNSLTSIGVAAFRECGGLTELTLSNSLTSIGESAF